MAQAVQEDIKQIQSASAVLGGGRVYTHGYCVHSLPEDLRDKLTDALSKYVGDCMHNAYIDAREGAEKENIADAIDTYADECSGSTLRETDIVDNSVSYVLGRCECGTDYKQSGKICIKK